MLELTGKCCGGIEAIEFMESFADIIPEDDRTNEFCEKFQASLNRFRYEVSKGIGTKKKIVKAVRKGHHDLQYCGKCGFGAEEANYNYCPNCGTKYLKD